MKLKKSKLPGFRVRKPSSMTLPFLGLLVGLSLIVMIAAFVYVYFQNSWNSEYASYFAEQKLLSQRIATSALEVATGNEEALDNLQGFRDRYQQTLDLVRDGNIAATPPLPALPATPDNALGVALNNLTVSWEEYRDNVDSILDKRDSISAFTGFVSNVSEALVPLKRLTEDIAAALSTANTNPATLYVASRQTAFIERTQTNLERMLTGGQEASTAADQFGRDFRFYARVMDGLINGSRDLDIQRVNIVEVQNMLLEVQEIYNRVQTSVTGILDNAPILAEVKDAAAAVQIISPEILDAGVKMEEALNGTLAPRVVLFAAVGGGAFAVAAFMLVIMAVVLLRGARRRAADSLSINQRNQEAILRLLDEMTALSDGDLTAHATVTEDITGAIADSVNFSIDALRNLVEAINNTVVRVSQSSEHTQAIATRLADASNQQAAEIATTTDAISQMARTMEHVSRNAETSADVALKSVQIASKGAQTVRRNIDGMDSIRETIQETSKRIKRLGESSQQIGEIVSLITDIADRTNILALNAAIQASSAGEAGRGFAVVADEVQRLAERSGNATKQISALVETIQTDTNEAVSSMEQSTAGVVTGAKLAEDAGNALTEIESVSKQLADLITTISKDAREQAKVAVNISESMNVIKRITMETSEGTNDTAKSIANLTELANELRTSVAGFKLPDSSDLLMAVNE